MLDFPSSPSDGQVFRNIGLSPWQYQASKGVWRRFAGTALPLNLISNPAMQISQQYGDTDQTAFGTFVTDEHAVYGGGTCSCRLQRVAVPTPGGSPYRIRNTINSVPGTLTSSDWISFETWIEGFKAVQLKWPGGSPIVVRFGWKGPAGEWDFSIRNWDYNRYYLTRFTVPAAKANQDIEVVIPIPAPPSGTWYNDNYGIMGIDWCVFNYYYTSDSNMNQWKTGNQITSAGSNLAQTGDVFELFDVGVYADPYNTGLPPPFEVPDYVSELRRCQRNYVKMALPYGALNFNAQGANYYYTRNIKWPVPMRTVPGYTWDFTSGVVSLIGTNQIDNVTPLGCRLLMISNGASTNNNMTFNSSFITANSRM